MGPSSKVDPLSMLNEAKRICDQLVSLASDNLSISHVRPVASESYPARWSTATIRLPLRVLSTSIPSINIRSRDNDITTVCRHHQPFYVRNASQYARHFTTYLSHDVHYDAATVPHCALLSISPCPWLLSGHANPIGSHTTYSILFCPPRNSIYLLHVYSYCPNVDDGF